MIRGVAPAPWRAEARTTSAPGLGEGVVAVSVLDRNRRRVGSATVRPGLDAVANGRMMAAGPALYAALADLVARCDGPEGVRADGSNIPTAQAHALLAALESET